MGWQWPILLLWCFSTAGINRVHAQLPTGFISIDCGIPAGHNYIDSVTKIPYTSDSGFIDTGDNYNVTSFTPQELTLRSFTNGLRRNCYTIKPVQNDFKYLVRATFMYGNYDGNDTTKTKPIVFNLHIGVNFWTTINIVNASVVYRAEALIAPTRPFIWVCLVDIGSGTPFISSLEVRPLEKTIYDAVNETNPLGLLARVDMGSAGKAVRYPDDLSDRIWDPHSDNISYPKIPDEWQAISINSTLGYSENDTFRVPSTVMQTAVIRQLKNDEGLNFRWYHDNWLNFSWYGGRDWHGADYKYYMNIHFTDIDERAHKLLRKLNVYVNEKLLFHNYRPPYMLPGYQYSTSPLDHGDEYRVSIRGSSDSDLPPIMNALEVYYVINLTIPATDHNDGKHSGSSNLNWGKRIRIALEAAQGFEYLHKGCTPPVIHGDVKTANILLGQRFEAKLADFGLSKSFNSDEDTHVSTTQVGGTFGYLDPEYHRTKHLNEKSDVYSFGVVLLELVTGQPPRQQVDSETVHIVKWVKNLRRESEDINVVVDSKLQGNYAINSILKVVSIALECTSEASKDRPMMTDVVIQLKESLDLEAARSSEHSGPRSVSVLSAR